MKPRCKQFEIDGKYFRFSMPLHLRRDEDWHNALIPVIDRLVIGKGSLERPLRVPTYPLQFFLERSQLLYELGSYWEGAIYFLRDKRRARELLSHVKMLEQTPDQEGFLDKLFLAIWNSHGQLKWLKAHLVREQYLTTSDVNHCSPDQIRRLANTSNNSDLEWLASFVEQHAGEGYMYPNPYFGGTNPLHLGLVKNEL